MPFIKPGLPDLDYTAWAKLPRMARLKPFVQSWAVDGFGTPDAVLLLYVVKIGLYVLGGAWIASRTPGIGSLGDITSWWFEPIVFQKVVVFTLLFEVLGFGCGFGPLTLRFLPPLGTFLYWLRPGTIRLPPWPGKVPGTAGTRRTVLDVLLYVGVITSAVWLLASPGDGLPGVLAPERMLPLLILLPVLGLRDKTIFLAARAEVYGTFVLTFLLTGADAIVAAKLVMLVIWWGAAASKLNRHFPYAVSVMLSNSAALRIKAVKKLLYRSHPDDIRPSRLSEMLAHGGTVVEFVVPLALFVSHGGLVTTVAAVVMIMFHVHIITALPVGVPLEWNVFMIFGIGVLFVHDAGTGLENITQPVPIVFGVLALVAVIVLGDLFPAKFSFLMSMRYYAGNWATSLWCMTPQAIAKLEAATIATLPKTQLVRLYGEDVTNAMMHKAMAFRAMHSHGRALLALIPRAAGPEHETRYTPVEGEFVAGVALGWNFGEGHLHNEQLIAALQERIGFAEGQVRVIVLESQPFWRPRQEYRLVDAATGEFERGHVEVADMLTRQPWAGEIPITLAERYRTDRTA